MASVPSPSPYQLPADGGQRAMRRAAAWRARDGVPGVVPTSLQAARLSADTRPITAP